MSRFNPIKHWKGCRFVHGYIDQNTSKAVLPKGWQKDPKFLCNGTIPPEETNLRTIGNTIENMELVLEPGEKSDGSGKTKEEWEEIAENNIRKYGFVAEKWSHGGKACHYHLRDWKGVSEEDRLKVFKYITKIICVGGYDNSLCGTWKLISVENKPHWKDPSKTRIKKLLEVINPEGKNVLTDNLMRRVESEERAIEKSTVLLTNYNVDDDVKKLYDLLITKEFPPGTRQMTVIKNLVVGLKHSSFSEEEKRHMKLEVARVQKMNPNSFFGFDGMHVFNHNEINNFCEENKIEPIYKLMPRLLEELSDNKSQKEKEEVLVNIFKAMKKETPFMQVQYDEILRKKLDIKKGDYSQMKAKYSPASKPHYDFAREIMQKYDFISLSHKNIFVYQDGIYSDNGVQIITQEMEELNENSNDKRIVDEVINTIYRLTIQSEGKMIKEADDKHLCLNNGILNTETMEIHPHDSQFVFLSKIPVDYDSNVDTEPVMEYFKTIVDEKDIPILCELFAWVLEPTYYPENIVMLNGSGSNGKSKFLSIFRKFLGKENYATVSLSQLQKDKFKPAELFGKLADLISETSNKIFEDTDLLKMLTGGDEITVEKKGKDPFKYVNRAKIINSCNELPKTKDTSVGFFRRMIVIDFPNTFIGKNAKTDIVETMTTEKMLSAFLLVGLQALKRLRKNKAFTGREDMEKNAEVFMNRSDAIEDFLNYYIEDYKGKVEGNDIRDHYEEYCKEKNIPPVAGMQTIYGEIKKKFPNCHNTRWRNKDGIQVRGVKGITRIKDYEDDDAPERPGFRSGV